MRGIEFLVAIINNGNPSELRQYGEDYFVGEDEIACYRYCIDHISNYARLPTLDTLEEETGIELPPAEDSVEYYANALTDRKLYNDLRGPFGDMREAIGDQNMEAARNAITAMSSMARVANPEIDLVNIGEAGQIALDRYERNHRIDGLIGVPSGWASMDEQTAGYQGGDLIAYVARPETGKTWLMLYQLFCGHNQGSNVLLATMEMPIYALANRFYALAAGISPDDIRRGRLDYYDEQRFRDTVQRYTNDDMFHMYQANLGAGMDGLESVIAEIRPDAVYIDGVYMMKSGRSRKQAQKNEAVTDVLDDLKQMALRRDCPIIITSQFNREGRGNKGSLENVGYSDAFSTHCSLVFALQRPDRGANDRATRVIRTIKGREGESGTFAVHYKFNPVNFGQTDLRSTVNPQDGEVDLDWMST